MLTKSLSYLFTTADFLLVYLLTRPTVNKENSYMVASSRCNFFLLIRCFHPHNLIVKQWKQIVISECLSVY